MSQPVSLSKVVFNKLSKHYCEFADYQKDVLNNSSLVSLQEREMYQTLFSQYNHHLQRLLKNACTDDSDDHHLPFVTIGSIVELENLQNKRRSRIMMSFPFMSQGTAERIARTSYISPMGQALFLKRPGDNIEVHAPGGLFLYRILSIILPIP